jgi:lipoate-protein ligase B
MTALRYAWLGRVGYAEAASLQEALRRRILDGDDAAEQLLLVEHDPVITLGRSARPEHLLTPPEALKAAGIAVERSTRGGGVTQHGPGQLVAYPVMRLSRGVVAHVEALADAAIAVARAHGVEARFRRDCPGVWVGDDKLASIGVHVHRRVAIHGLSLNVDNDLGAFDRIVACGTGARPTSLRVVGGRALAVTDVAPAFALAFARALGRQAIEVSAATPELLSQIGSVE